MKELNTNFRQILENIRLKVVFYFLQKENPEVLPQQIWEAIEDTPWDGVNLYDFIKRVNRKIALDNLMQEDSDLI